MAILPSNAFNSPRFVLFCSQVLPVNGVDAMDDIDVATSNGEFEAQEFAMLLPHAHAHAPEIHGPPRIDSLVNIQEMYICILDHFGRPFKTAAMDSENVRVVRVHFSGPPSIIVLRPPEKKPRLDVAEQVRTENGVDKNGMPSPSFTNAAGTPSSSNWS